MPLAFDSLSHGKIAFGFFNIETDLLLLNRYFFFASDFCRHLMKAAEGLREGKWEAAWEVYSLEEAAVGNLMGAIHGFDLRGFIGEVYRLFPFPEDPEGFKQNPEGYRDPALDRVDSTELRFEGPGSVPVNGRQEAGAHRRIPFCPGKLPGIAFVCLAGRISALA